MYVIYGIFNNLNGKLYIGLTKNLVRRWYEHVKNSKTITSNSYAVHHALAKYGIKNFILKKIDDAIDLNEANLKEMLWIKELKINGYQLYNETNGGDGIKKEWTEEQKQKAKWTEERKAKLSQRNSGKGNPMYGVQLFGKANGNFGKGMKPHVKEILLKIRCKLTAEQVKEIRHLYSLGNYTQENLSKQYNICISQINRIIHETSWGSKKRGSAAQPRLKKEEVLSIREMHKSGNYTMVELAAKYNRTRGQISRIVNNKMWKNIK